MAISCVYCGGFHASARDVRECWVSRQDAEDATGRDTPSSQDRTTVSHQQVGLTPSTAPAPSERPIELCAGPDELGRNLVITTDGAVPAPWESAPCVTVDRALLADPDAVASLCRELRRLGARRERSVVRVDVPLEPDEPSLQIERRPLHELGARYQLLLDDLWHLVWSNAVDGRSGTTGRWWLADLASNVGARPVTDGSADVRTSSGEALWLHGGPLHFFAPIEGIGVVHRSSLEHGHLTPFGENKVTGPAEQLAPDQHAAVVHDGGAARIIAPAGSGKTRVLTERACHLVDTWRLPASAVSLVAFNTRAQSEMRERTSRRAPELQVRTLNSIALALVNGVRPFAAQAVRRRTITEGEVRQLLGTLIEVPRRRNTDPYAPWIEALSVARLGLRSPSDVEDLYDGDVVGFAEVLPRYRELLAARQLLDFDEQIVAAIELLLTDPVARAAAQRSCRALLVDEFQDLTPAHILLVRLLAGPDLNVFGVGDDDQTIYGYNGADPTSLIEFDELFPGAGDHPLQVNYRCPGGVVSAVDTLLRHNRRRVPKTIVSADPDRHGWNVAGGKNSLSATLSAVRDALDAGHAPSEVAVLTRVNALLAPVQVGLQTEGIPCRAGVGVDFLERTAVRATLAWLRLAQGTWIESDLGETLRRPSRSMHPRVADWVTETRNLDDLVRLSARLREPRDSQRVEEYAADIAALESALTRGRTTGEVLDVLFHEIGLAGSIVTLDANRHGMNRGAQHDDLTALAQLATLHTDAASFPSWLSDQLRGTLVARRDRASGGDEADGHQQGVTLATVHRVKGQEWPVVVIHEVTASQFPHRLADDLEEERRLFHVAMTRAASQVTVVAGEEPSPFIDELTIPAPTAPTTPPGPSKVRQRYEAERQGTGPPGRTGTRRSPAERASVPGPAAEALRTSLKELRLQLAAGKPAYTVFDDATLEALIAARPSDVAQLRRIPGIGPKRLEAYGGAILEVLAGQEG